MALSRIDTPVPHATSFTELWHWEVRCSGGRPRSQLLRGESRRIPGAQELGTRPGNTDPVSKQTNKDDRQDNQDTERFCHLLKTTQLACGSTEIKTPGRFSCLSLREQLHKVDFLGKESSRDFLEEVTCGPTVKRLR